MFSLLSKSRAKVHTKAEAWMCDRDISSKAAEIVKPHLAAYCFRTCASWSESVTTTRFNYAPVTFMKMINMHDPNSAIY